MRVHWRWSIQPIVLALTLASCGSAQPVGTPSAIPSMTTSSSPTAPPAFSVQLTPIPGESGWVQGVASDGDVVVAVGSTVPAGSSGQFPRAWRSADGGLSWDGATSIGEEIGQATSVIRVAGRWVAAVGGHEGIYLVSSVDGHDWTRTNLPIAYSTDTPFVVRVGDRAVLFGLSGDVWFESADGLRWQRRALDLGPGTSAWGVVGSPTGMIVVGQIRNGPGAWRVDGDTVVRASIEPLPGVADVRFAAVAANADGSYVAVSRNGPSSLDGASAWRSADGTSWQLVSAALPNSYGAFAIQATPLGLIAVGIGGGGVYQSSDGTTWDDAVPILGNATISGLTPTSKGFIAVGGQTSHGPWFAMLAPVAP